MWCHFAWYDTRFRQRFDWFVILHVTKLSKQTTAKTTWHHATLCLFVWCDTRLNILIRYYSKVVLNAIECVHSIDSNLSLCKVPRWRKFEVLAVNFFFELLRFTKQLVTNKNNYLVT